MSEEKNVTFEEALAVLPTVTFPLAFVAELQSHLAAAIAGFNALSAIVEDQYKAAVAAKNNEGESNG
jgi:hypothetical protein